MVSGWGGGVITPSPTGCANGGLNTPAVPHARNYAYAVIRGDQN